MAVAISFVCVLVTLTVTPGIGSPAASTTRPVTVARNSCDHADGETRQARTRRICTLMRGERLIISFLQRRFNRRSIGAAAANARKKSGARCRVEVVRPEGQTSGGIICWPGGRGEPGATAEVGCG